MTKEQLKIFKKHVDTYCRARVKPPGKEVSYPDLELKNNPQHQDEIKDLLNNLNQRDFSNPEYKKDLECLKTLINSP